MLAPVFPPFLKSLMLSGASSLADRVESSGAAKATAKIALKAGIDFMLKETEVKLQGDRREFVAESQGAVIVK